MSVAEIESLEEERAFAEELPLSYGQRALWFLERLAPGNPAYVIAGAGRLRGRVEPAALWRAAAALSARHPALRTTFNDGADGPVQRVGEAPRVDFVEADGRALAEPELLRQLSGAAFAPFDFERGPLWRLVLVRLDGGGYALALSIHHIVADFWSLAILVRELGVLYGREMGLAPEPLPPLPLPAVAFAAVVEREAERLAGAEGERLREYWDSALAGVPLVLDLPADRPRPRVQGYRGDWRPFRLPAETVDRLRRLSRRQGATLYMALLAGFEALLGRYTGQERLIVGCPTTGRSAPELAGLVGYLVNPVAIAADLAGDPDGLALLERTRAAATAAFAHQGYPFALLAERLEPQRDPGRAPVIQALFVLQKGRRSGEQAIAALAVGKAGVRVAMGPLEFESLALPDPGAQLDLSVMLAESGGELAGRLQYDRELFEAATIDRLGGHLAALLSALAAEPGLRLSALPLLAAGERAQLLAEGNDTAVARPAGPLVHERFAAWARLRPEALALASPAGRLSYGELAAAAGRLARRLRGLGVGIGAGAEVRVAVCAGLTLERVVGLLAVLAAGGAYVPLDPDSPPERLAFLLADCGAAVLLAERQLAGRLPATSLPVLYLERGAGRSAGQKAPGTEPAGELPAARPVLPEDLAYIIYTSGSTGVPKGVAVPHSGLLNLVLWHQERYGVTPADRATQIASPAFDASVWELWPYLAAGASVHIPDPETRLSPRGLVDWWEEEGITFSFLPTPLAESVLAEGGLPGGARVAEGRPGLRLRGLLCGGDRLHRAPPPGLPFPLLNHYGPSESSVVTTSAPVPPVPAATPGLPAIGRPIDNTWTLVLDAWGALAPLGVEGELGDRRRGPRARLPGPAGADRGALRSRPLERRFRGAPLPYWGPGASPRGRQPRLPGPCRPPGQGAGFPDRAGGDRSGPGERPGRLGSGGPGTRGPAGRPPARRLCRAGGGSRGERGAARRSQPSGRGSGAPPAGLYGPPRLRRPRRPAALDERQGGPAGAGEPAFGDGGGRRRVDGAPDFPGGPAGGDLGRSAGAGAGGRPGQLLRPRRPLAPRHPAGLLGAAGSRGRAAAPGGLRGADGGRARRSDCGCRERGGGRRAGPGAAPAGTPGGGEAGREAGLPLSFAQERLWFLDQLQPGDASYNIAGAARLTGRLSSAAIAAMSAAFSAVVERHAALRTRFRSGDEGPVQVVAPAVRQLLPRVDLAGLPAAPRAVAVRRLAAEEAARPFDLAAGPLVRVCLLRLETGLRRETRSTSSSSLCTTSSPTAGRWRSSSRTSPRSTGRPSPAVRRRCRRCRSSTRTSPSGSGPGSPGRSSNASSPGGGSTWPGHPPSWPCRPTGRGRRCRVSGAAGCRWRFPPGLADRLTAFGRESQGTLFMVLLAGFAALLGRVAGAEDLVVGAPVANRQRSEVEGLIGFFVNPLALRTDLSGEPPFAALLDRVRTVTLEAYAHQDVPFEKLVLELAPERSLGHSPLFQVVLALQNVPLAPLALPGLALERLPPAEGTAKFDLTLSLGETGAREAGALEYNRALFDRVTAERLAAAFVRLLEGAVGSPRTRLGALPLLSAGERAQLLAEWNDTAMARPAGPLVHERFAAWARLRPEALALASPAGRLRYGELSAAAGRLARRLRNVGVGVGGEVRVAVCAGLTLERVVGLLAVLMVGGAYVPLDPDSPPERLAFLLADCGAAVLLAERRLAGRLPATSLPVLYLEGALDEAAAEPEGENPAARPVQPEDLAYIIYTSGSTGVPKGVSVPHSGLLNLVLWHQERYGVTPADRATQIASPAFDASVWELWPYLAAGASVHIPDPETRLSPRGLVDWWEREGITLSFLPTPLAESVLAEGGLAGMPGMAGWQRGARGSACAVSSAAATGSTVRRSRGCRSPCSTTTARRSPASSPRRRPFRQRLRGCRPSAGRSTTPGLSSSTPGEPWPPWVWRGSLRSAGPASRAAIWTGRS